MTETPDPTIRAALEAGLSEAWGMSEAQFYAALRRYDAIRFKELHERVAELEAKERPPRPWACKQGEEDNDKSDWMLVSQTLWLEIQQAANNIQSRLSAANEALKAEREVRGMLGDLAREARQIQRDRYGDGMMLHLDMIVWARKYDALAAAQALDEKEG